MTAPRPDLSAPIIEFPGDLVDTAGRPLRPGLPVRVHGPHPGRTDVDTVDGVISRYNPDRGLEILTGEDRVIVAVPGQVERLGSEPDPTMAGLTVIEADGPPTCLVAPVGARELQTRPDDPGPFPVRDPRPGQSSTAEWAAACRTVLDARPPAERDDLLDAHLDAPMIRRALTEALLPRRLERLILLVTSQTPPHPLDTAPLGDLLTAWIGATARRRQRELAYPVEVVTITTRPDVIADVHDQLTERLTPHFAGAQRLAVIHAGGTPAMTFAATLTAATASDHPVRIIQVVRGGRVSEIDFTPHSPIPVDRVR